jgi:hypothetical protein
MREVSVIVTLRPAASVIVRDCAKALAFNAKKTNAAAKETKR